MVSPCVEVLRELDRTFNSDLGADQGTRHAPHDLTNDIQALISSLEEHRVYYSRKSTKRRGWTCEGCSGYWSTESH